jgi:hypothetical protein
VAQPNKHPIDPKSEDFKEILSAFPFEVPRYQRAFDWDAEEVRDWARDLIVIATQRIAKARRRHFFGAIISVSSAATKTFEVVDGQQRLTTEILSLTELKARYETLAKVAKAANKVKVASDAKKEAQGVDNCLETAAGVPRLTLSQRDKQFFADMLAGSATKPTGGADESHKRLWKARDILRAELFDVFLKGASTAADQLKRLNALRDALLEDGYLVHLFTNDARDAYQVFMILNDRGRPLSTGSLLRTHTLAVLASHSAQQSGAETDWDSILSAGDRVVDSFLIAYYVSYQGDRVPKGELYRSFRDVFLVESVKTVGEANALRTRIGTLRAEMGTFRRIRGGEWPYDNPTVAAWERDRLSRLTTALGHDLANPLLLATARTVDEKVFRDLVLVLEPFVFRYINVVGASPTRLQAEYYKAAKATRVTGKLDINTLRNALKKLMTQLAPDTLFEAQLREQLRFGDGKPRKLLIRHFLTTLEDYEKWYSTGASGKPKVQSKTSVFDLEYVNIEHIYPQNPPVPDPSLANLTNALGNLTALDPVQGGQIGNGDFKTKKPEYAKSKFLITQPLAALPDDWTPQRIQDRFDFYTVRAKKLFVVR